MKMKEKYLKILKEHQKMILNLQLLYKKMDKIK
jgi:hypothetical protein